MRARVHRVIFLVVLSLASAVAIAQDYEVIDLGAGVSPSRVINSGQVVGSDAGRPFVWTEGTFTYISGTDPVTGQPWTQGSAAGINSAGTVVGTARVAPSGSRQPNQAFISTGGSATLPGIGSSSVFTDINEAGVIAGAAVPVRSWARLLQREGPIFDRFSMRTG